MAVTYVAKSEVKVASGTSIQIPIPTGWAVGNVLIAYITKDDDDAITPPAGWTVIQNINSGTAMRLWTGYRIAQSGDTNWTWTGDSEAYYGVIICYSGQKATTPVPNSGNNTGTDAAPIAPSVGFTNLNAGSLVLQVFGADNPSKSFPYNFPAQLASKFNDEAGTIGGAGGGKTTFLGWVSPTGHNNPDTIWDDETLAYDDDTGVTSYAKTFIPLGSWGKYLEITRTVTNCSKVRFYAYYYAATINQISLDVYYGDAWHNIYEGDYIDREWVEKEIGSTQTVTAMRVKFYNNYTSSYYARLYEVDFFGTITEGTGETGTAVFGMAASDEWAAVTAVIEALAESGLINGYYMQDGAREEKTGYYMNTVEEFGYYMRTI